MLTKDDLKQIKDLILVPLEKRFGGLEKKVDRLIVDVDELKLETKGIHLILERHEKDFGERLERLEQETGIN